MTFPTSIPFHGTGLRSYGLAVALALLAGTQLLGARAAVAEPYRVADINPVPAPDGSDPESFVAHGRLAYFVADDGESGRELWRSDGRAAGTLQVLDVCEGPCSGNPVLRGGTPRGVFFTAFDRSARSGLWLAGRAAPRRLAEHLVLASVGHGVWVDAVQRLFFIANDGIHGAELWSSDGTAAGTGLVRDLTPGPAGSSPTWPIVHGSRVYFTASVPGIGPSLWTSDGTAAGTRLVMDPIPGSPHGSPPAALSSVGSRLVFAAFSAGRGVELWSTDGTPKGTFALPELVRGPGSPTLLRYRVLAGRLWLQASTPQAGQELWVTDGTPKGTRAVTAFGHSRPFGEEPFTIHLPRATLGNRIVFSADDGVHGTEPWMTDGTRAGTRLLRDVCPGACSGEGVAMAQVGPRLLVQGNTPAHGWEPWVTDGTAEGTRLLADLCLGDCTSSAFVFGGAPPGGATAALVTTALAEGGQQRTLWITDGTSAGTREISDPGTVAAPAGTTSGIWVRNRLFFAGQDEEHDIEPWASDGTRAGTRLVADLARRDLGGSHPGELFGAGLRVYFFANDGIHGAEPWSSDGTEGGTSLLADLEPGRQSGGSLGFASGAAALGSQVVFGRHRPGAREIWRTDGTTAGTFRLTPEGLDAARPATAGGQVFFVAGFPSDEELWATDGSVEGTRRVADLAAGAFGSRPTGLVAFGDRVAFWADGDEGRGLWVSDGTEAGTELVPGLEGADPLHLAEQLAAGGELLFLLGRSPTTGFLTLWKTDGTADGSALLADLGWYASSGPTLHPLGSGVIVLGPQGAWWSDGTAAGTLAISDLPLGQGGFSPPLAFAGSLYFPVHHEGQRLLWRSDGTAAGTGPVLDHLARPIRDPQAPRVLGGSLVFAALEGGDTWLWTSQGTTDTTRPLHRLRAGSGWGIELAVANSRLFFAGHDEAGWELWALRP